MPIDAPTPCLSGGKGCIDNCRDARVIVEVETAEDGGNSYIRGVASSAAKLRFSISWKRLASAAEGFLAVDEIAKRTDRKRAYSARERPRERITLRVLHDEDEGHRNREPGTRNRGADRLDWSRVRAARVGVRAHRYT